MSFYICKVSMSSWSVGDRRRSKEFLRLTKRSLPVLTLTGHCSIRNFAVRLTVVSNPYFRSCLQVEDMDSAQTFLLSSRKTLCRWHQPHVEINFEHAAFFFSEDSLDHFFVVVTIPRKIFPFSVIAIDNMHNKKVKKIIALKIYFVKKWDLHFCRWI